MSFVLEFFCFFLLTLPQKLTLCCVTLSSSFHVSSSMLMVSCLSSFFLLPFLYFAVLFGQLCDSHPLSSFSLLSAIGGVPFAFYHIFSLIQCRENRPSSAKNHSYLGLFVVVFSLQGIPTTLTPLLSEARENFRLTYASRQKPIETATQRGKVSFSLV